MNNFNLEKEICAALDRAEKESRKNTYIMKEDTIKKVKLLSSFLRETNFSIEFDRVINTIEICLTGYVLDSCTCDLKSVFKIVDLFVIDSLNDGKVCIEMKILNAAKIIRR